MKNKTSPHQHNVRTGTGHPQENLMCLGNWSNIAVTGLFVPSHSEALLDK